MKIVILFSFMLNVLFALPEEFDKNRYQIGEKIFDNKCSECHIKSMPMQTLLKNFIEEENKLLNLKAPAGNQISYRLKSQIGSKDDIEFQIEEDIDFLKEYLINPNKENTICLEGVVKYFDSMPSMKGKITEEEIEDVTFFLYFLEGFNGVNEFYNKEDEF